MIALVLLSFEMSGALANSSSEKESVNADPALKSLVPEFYRNKGSLHVAVNPDVVPIKFVDESGNMVGFAPDILSAAAKILDINLELNQSSFDALIPGLNSNRFDVLISLADYKARQQNVTFVDYLSMGETVVSTLSFEKEIASNDDLCGLKLAVVKGTGSVQEVENVNKKCVDEGKVALDISTYSDANTALLSISTGVSDAAWVDSPVGYYNVHKFPDKFKVVYFNPLSTYGIGFGVDVNSKKLAFAFQQALRKLYSDGVFDQLVVKWKLDAKDTKRDFPINGM